ncbi:MAG: hypothetical protein L3J98_09325 [Gammaproteobacteria bacterium]|nr:hypothetical protein [Gammaproteobacteria bacterium]
MKIYKLIWVFLLPLFVVGCNNNGNTNAAQHSTFLFEEKIICPEGAIAEVDLWGKNGASRSCKMKHGTFIGWENGHKIYQAQYEFGKLTGKAFWFDESGNIIKEVDNSDVAASVK